MPPFQSGFDRRVIVRRQLDSSVLEYKYSGTLWPRNDVVMINVRVRVEVFVRLDAVVLFWVYGRTFEDTLCVLHATAA
jgi:hypothetical protein